MTGPVTTRCRVLLYLHVRRDKVQTCKGFDHFEHSERKESKTEINRKIATERDTQQRSKEKHMHTKLVPKVHEMNHTESWYQA